MSGTATAEDNTVDGNDEDFDAGFAGKQDAPTGTPDALETPDPADPAVVEPTAPEYVQITKEDFQRLNASAAAVEELRATLTSQGDKTFGKIGGLERVIKELQSATPAGEAVELSEEDMADFAAEYPELASLQRTVLNKALSKIKLRGTGTAETIAPEQIDEMVAKRLDPALKGVDERVEHLVESRLLSRDFPDWREIVDAGNPESKNPYRTWLASQPAEYQNQVNSATSSDIVRSSITKFKDAEKAAKAISQRQSRVEAAVTPRGAGGNAASTPTDDDEFEAGFKG
jgi:hypothetical protein